MDARPQRAGEAAQQVTMSASGEGAEFILDLDRDGHLLGIEILGASHGLRPESPDVPDGELGQALRHRS